MVLSSITSMGTSTIKFFKVIGLFVDEFLLSYDANSLLVLIALLAIIYFSWKSTEVQDYRTIFLFGSRSSPLSARYNNIVLNFHLRGEQVLRNETPAAPTESSATSSNEESESQQHNQTTAPSMEEVIDEVNLVSEHQNGMDRIAIDSLEEDINHIIAESFGAEPLSGPEQIIREMDNDRDDMELRYRPSTSSQARESSASENSSHAENCSNENNENENISKKDHVQLKAESLPSKDDTEFNIKLKYLNEEVRLVTGKPNEIIGDFKKRHFNIEIATQKLVRLVFNGHVLQPDNKTLQSCGLFDNCVVHCLIHNKKPQQSNDSLSSGAMGGLDVAIENNSNNSSGAGFLDYFNHGRFNTIFNYICTLSLLFCWFCRLEYSYLFNIYSTVGLILITVMLLIMLPLVYLMDWD